MICRSCKYAQHDNCYQKTKLGFRCDCEKCREDFLKSLRITEVEIKKGGRCLKVQIGNTTTFIDARDLYDSQSWNDREDNREETVDEIRSES